MDAHHRRDALLNWLRSRPTATAAEAAERFGVSPRTILRDVAALRERGEPVESDAGRGGGLRVDVLRSLPPVSLRLEEIVGLFLWYHLTQVTFGPPVAGAAEGAVEKLMAVLPANRAADLRKLLRRVVVRPAEAGSGQPTAGRPEALSCLERAFQARRVVHIEVRTDNGELLAHRGEPQGLLIEPPHWWLVLTAPVGAVLARIDQLVSVVPDEKERFSLTNLEDLLRRTTRLASPTTPSGLRVVG